MFHRFRNLAERRAGPADERVCQTGAGQVFVTDEQRNGRIAGQPCARIKSKVGYLCHSLISLDFERYVSLLTLNLLQLCRLSSLLTNLDDMRDGHAVGDAGETPESRLLTVNSECNLVVKELLLFFTLIFVIIGLLVAATCTVVSGVWSRQWQPRQRSWSKWSLSCITNHRTNKGESQNIVMMTTITIEHTV